MININTDKWCTSQLEMLTLKRYSSHTGKMQFNNLRQKNL